MAKKIITKTIEVKAEYDYIIFDGTNYDAVREFVELYKLYGNSDIEDSFHKRPDDIPNLDGDELLKWWQSTGEEKVDKRGIVERKYNTHNYHNMPLWQRDELLMIEFKSSQSGWVEREWLRKNDAIIVVGRRYYVVNNTDEKEVMDFIESPLVYS